MPDVTVIDLRDGERTGGARFGELVHAVLAAAPLGGDPRRLRVGGRGAGAHPRCVRRGARCRGGRRPCASPRTNCCAVPQQRRRVGAARRECPVTLTVADGAVLEGVVDLAFCESGRLDGRRFQDRSRDLAGRCRALLAAGGAVRRGDCAGNRRYGRRLPVARVRCRHRAWTGVAALGRAPEGAQLRRATLSRSHLPIDCSRSPAAASPPCSDRAGSRCGRCRAPAAGVTLSMRSVRVMMSRGLPPSRWTVCRRRSQ